MQKGHRNEDRDTPPPPPPTKLREFWNKKTRMLTYHRKQRCLLCKSYVNFKTWGYPRVPAHSSFISFPSYYNKAFHGMYWPQTSPQLKKTVICFSSAATVWEWNMNFSNYRPVLGQNLRAPIRKVKMKTNVTTAKQSVHRNQQKHGFPRGRLVILDAISLIRSTQQFL